MHKEHQDRPQIDYPCQWEYRIIGPSEDELKAAVIQIMGKRQYHLSFSNISKTGKYISLAVTTLVEDQAVRDLLYVGFAKHAAVKHVL